jgi:eukaryotic-like serine/threonine-protein kinase
VAHTPGTRLGVYEFTAPLGEGGMGQVWRARDTKLDRDVAIKVLPEAFAHDADRLVRFTREAKTLAALNHTNIAHIHGLEESSGVTALVMELVEGEDLSQRIGRGAIPLDEALPIAKQIAEALEAAHEQGIIHRDLKPANIKVRADGTVKVLDFGLAKALDPVAASSPEAVNSPTITSPAMTQAGMILGTAAYMAPEQARGTAVDKRADVWAFGVVLCEMLTGRRLFTGATVSDTIAAVLTREPDWTTLPAATPVPIRKLLRRCLEKDRKRRLTDAGAARLEIDDALTAPPTANGPSASGAPTTTASSRGQLPWIAALAVASALIAAMAVPTLRDLRQAPPPAPPEVRVDITTPATDRPSDFALSPDGRQIVYAAADGRVSRLWLRSLATAAAQPLPDTEGGRSPFWSPDSRSIGFSAAGELKRLDLGDQTAQVLARAGDGMGGTWNSDGVIVFAPNTTGVLMRVLASGGASAAATTLVSGQVAHRFPAFLPDGRRFVFYASGHENSSAGIYLGALDGSVPVRLVSTLATALIYLPARASAAGATTTGWVLWVRAAEFVAQRLDHAAAALVGEPVTIAGGLNTDTLTRSGVTAIPGLLAYRPEAQRQAQLTWMDRFGAARGTLGDPHASLTNPRISPDGRRVLVSRTAQGNEDLWLLDGVRASRFTFDTAFERWPVWSPDGVRMAFGSRGAGTFDLHQKVTTGAGNVQVVVASDETKLPTSWSADGRFLLYQRTDPKNQSDLWVTTMTGTQESSVILQTPFIERFGAFSPDGQWIAYQSNESGRNEVYVRTFVPPGATAAAPVGQWQVSTTGGIMPTWRPDGKELYYLDPEGALMAAPVAVRPSSLDPGTPVVLFPTRIVGGGVDAQQGRQYDVAADGRFLINTLLDGADAPIRLVLNWNPEAKK